MAIFGNSIDLDMAICRIKSYGCTSYLAMTYEFERRGGYARAKVWIYETQVWSHAGWPFADQELVKSRLCDGKLAKTIIQNRGANL